jgi:hypothetical protein
MSKQGSAITLGGRSELRFLLFALALALAAPAGSVHALPCQVGCDTPGGTPPPSLTSIPPGPHFAFQIKGCLSASEEQALVTKISNGLANALEGVDLNHDDPPPAPDVRSLCAANLETVAGWLEPVGTYGQADTSAARNQKLSLVKLLKPSETFGMRFYGTGIRRLLDLAWADLPKRLGDDGKADPNGDIHLQSLNVGYNNSVAGHANQKKVTIKVHGYAHVLFSNTGFDVRLIDTLSLSNEKVSCQSEPEVDVDTSIDTILATLVGAVQSSDGALSQLPPSGPGCQFAAMLPTDKMLAGGGGIGYKVVFKYKRLEATAAGLVAAGTHELAERQPDVSISGASILQVGPSETIQGFYSAVTHDLRPPLSYSWSSANATISGGKNATVHWNFSLSEGQHLYRTLHVTVTDADQMSASASKQVMIWGLLNPSLPPACETKPSLPQCNP